MRGNIRKWCALGALASAALVYPACKSDSRDIDPVDTRETGAAQMSRDDVSRPSETLGQNSVAPGTDSSDNVIMEDSQAGIGGSGSTTKAAHPKKGHADAGTSVDAGTGGAGIVPGTLGQGVTGSQSEELNSTGASNSGGIVPTH